MASPIHQLSQLTARSAGDAARRGQHADRQAGADAADQRRQQQEGEHRAAGRDGRVDPAPQQRGADHRLHQRGAGQQQRRGGRAAGGRAGESWQEYRQHGGAAAVPAAGASRGCTGRRCRCRPPATAAPARPGATPVLAEPGRSQARAPPATGWQPEPCCRCADGECNVTSSGGRCGFAATQPERAGLPAVQSNSSPNGVRFADPCAIAAGAVTITPRSKLVVDSAENIPQNKLTLFGACFILCGSSRRGGRVVKGDRL